MAQTFDFVVVGGGSAGAVIAARLSEDPTCRVALVEAGERPPAVELMPVACATMQLNPATDWMYTADAGEAGLGLADGRMMVPRGKMLGGSSGINYMAYVRGHPGDFDAWAAGRRHRLELRRRPALLQEERRARRRATTSSSTPTRTAPTVRSGCRCVHRCSRGAQEFVDAAVAAGIPRGDYNGRDRGGAAGVVSLLQTTHARRQALEHVPRVPRRRRRAATEPHDDHRRARDARAARGGPGS